MALWRTGEEAMVRLANLQADVTRFEMAGRFTVAAALHKVALTGYLFVLFLPSVIMQILSIVNSLLAIALPQKSSFIGFGFASCCEAWLCPAVCER